MSYSCRNGVEHKKDEWCRQRLTEEESAQLRALLKKIAACHIPHSSSWCSGGECPACWAEDFYGNDDDPGRALWCDNNEDAIMAGRAALAAPKTCDCTGTDRCSYCLNDNSSSQTSKEPK